ncbi:signal peptidase II [Candidatus Woesearchaeota archaeon]|nr:signal peptidase II [Candidatus Woesearchaeota archaeon]
MNKEQKNKLFLFLSTALSVIFLDQLTKYIVHTNLSIGQSFYVIKNIFHLTYISNTGAGFGIFKDSVFLLSFISVIAIGAIIYYYPQLKNRFLQSGAALMLGGTIGNLIDRIFRGYVIDFLDFRIWPLFNIADTAITIGTFILIIYFIKER